MPCASAWAGAPERRSSACAIPFRAIRCSGRTTSPPYTEAAAISCSTPSTAGWRRCSASSPCTASPTGRSEPAARGVSFSSAGHCPIFSACLRAAAKTQYKKDSLGFRRGCKYYILCGMKKRKKTASAFAEAVVMLHSGAAHFVLRDQYMPPPMPPPAGAAGSGAGISVTTLSVVSRVAATEAAFCKALRVTLVGSMMPLSIISV